MSERNPTYRLGGMALRNGVVVHGPTSWSVAVRRRDGTIAVASGTKRRVSPRAFERMPGLRGLMRLGEALAVVPAAKRQLPAARLAVQEPAAAASLVAATAGAALLRWRLGRTLAGELASAVIGTLPAVVALRGGELAAYHGAEHKAIAAYEHEAQARDVPAEHDRCGSNLLMPLVVATIGGNVAARRAGVGERAAGPLVLAVSTAFAVELLRWCERHSDTALARAVHRAGFEIQHRLGTREPTPRQLEVAEAGLSELLRAEASASA